MKKAILFLLAVQLTALASVWANGGPMDGSSIIKVGELRFVNKADIDLVKEQLSFTVLEGDSIKVKVVYHLKNYSDSANGLIDYAFPLDYDPVSESEVGIDGNSISITDLCFSIDGELLPYTEQEEELLYPTEIVSNYGDYNIEAKRRWFFTQFAIERGKDAILEISYLIRPFFEDFATSKSFFTSFSTRELYWDFRPAQYWGDGIIEDFEVVFDVRNPQIDEASLTLQGLPFVKEKNTYVYRTKNFDLKQSEPLYIEYDLDFSRYYIGKGNLFNTDNAIGIKASSSQKNYPLGNIKDNKLSTTWCPAGDGIEEWIEIETKGEHTVLGAIVMFSGYTKSRESYYNNNRPKTIKIERFNSYDQEGSQWVDVINLEDIDYDKRQASYLYENILCDFGDGGYGIKKIRITILDVYKGEKYNDTCISEIYLLGYIYNPDSY